MIRNFLSLFAISARLTLSTVPDLGSATIAFVRVVAVPVTTGLFYLALATGAGAVPPSTSNALAAGTAVGAMGASMAASALVTLDKFEGTMPHLLLASSGRAAAWAGRLFTLVGLGLVTAVTVSIVGLVIAPRHWEFPQLLLFVSTLVIAAFGGMGIGLLLGAIGLGLRDSLLLANFAEFFLPLICGAVAPIVVLPIPLQWITSIIPITPAISAARSLGEGGSTVEVATQLVISIALGCVWLLAGLLAWRLVERVARSSGAFELSPL